MHVSSVIEHNKRKVCHIQTTLFITFFITSLSLSSGCLISHQIVGETDIELISVKKWKFYACPVCVFRIKNGISAAFATKFRTWNKKKHVQSSPKTNFVRVHKEKERCQSESHARKRYYAFSNSTNLRQLNYGLMLMQQDINRRDGSEKGREGKGRTGGGKERERDR